MPLSSPVAREKLHTRRIVIEGYEREDGNFDVEAHLTDTKPFEIDNEDEGTLPPGKPLHEMWVRLTFDPRMTILAAEACTDHGPYAACSGGAAAYERLVGQRIKAGFLREANSRLAGAHGCTHHREMLQEIATTALQSMWPARERRIKAARAVATPEAAAIMDAKAREAEAREASGMIDSCIAYAADGAVVRKRWPGLYTGAAEPARAE